MYDLIVLGAGSAGLTASLIAAEIGLDVALIDKDEQSIGGECLRSGCVPSKSLLHVSKKAYESRNAEQFGIKSKSDVNWENVKQYIKTSQKKIKKKESKEEVESHGITLLFGEATLETTNSVSVGKEKVEGKKILIATGSSPRRIGLDTTIPVYTNEEIFKIEKLPENLLVIGGGPIGLEIGQALSRLDVKVTLIERGEQILKRDPISITKRLQKELQKEFTIKTNTKITRVEEKKVQLSDGTTMKPDAILLGIGRQPNIQGLGLEDIGVEYTTRGITVDKYCQTNKKAVYAVGDCNGKYQLSHCAEVESSIVIQNNIFPLYNKAVPYEDMSWVTYTDPQVATVGNISLCEKEQYTKHRMPFEEVDRTSIETGVGKGVIYEKNGYIKGASILHSRADSIIQELILAKQNNIKLRTFTSKIVPYPTHEMVTKLTAVNKMRNKIPNWIKAIGRKVW